MSERNIAAKGVDEAAALLKAGALQDAIINSANFSSIATDAKGVIQVFNVGAERMLGYAAADVLNKITPADISDPQELIARAKALSVELLAKITPGFEALVFKASRGIEDIYELTYIRKDGSRFPAVVSVTALRDSQGAIIGYLLIGTDNTARKQAEAELLRAGALQKAIFNSANFSSIATDAKGVIQIFNVGAERMLGFTAAEAVNKMTPAELSDPEELILRAKALSHQFGTKIEPGFQTLVFKASRGIEDIYELTKVRKDGGRFPAVVSVTALRDEHDAIIGYLLIGTDNTARKEIEGKRKILDQRLRDQQFYTRSLIESNIDALMATDLEGIITDVNKQMEALTGCTRDELVGAPFKNYFTDPERAEAGIKQVLDEGKVTNYELTARSRSGKETVVSYNAITFFDRDRRLLGVFASARDMTHLKRLETAQKLLEDQLRNKIDVEEQYRRVQEANRLKSEFLANMSHELRTPLNGIIGFSEILHDAKAGAINDQQKEYLGDILSSGRHLLQLINDILDLSKVESGKMEFRSEPLDLVKLVGEVRDVVRTMTAQKRIRFESEISPAVAGVVGDGGKLKQVLYNYLANALKFTADEGKVVVRIVPEDGNSFRLEVIDTGIGISKEGISRLFVEFQQLDSSMSKKHQGTGLGLALTKRIVEAQGGRVGVESEPGKGSTFFAVLPLHARENSEGEFVPATDTANAARTGAPLILVVDDDDKERNWLVKTLTEAGYAVEVAVSGAEAMARCASKRFDAVTLDILLPDMNGSDVLKAIRAGGPNQDTHVIVMTVVTDDKSLAAYPVHDYLAKPVSAEALRGSLERAGLSPGGARSILVIDDDPAALKQMAVWLKELGFKSILKTNATDGLKAAQEEHPALVVLDLVMPGLDGFAFLERFRTAGEGKRTPVIVWTSKDLNKEELRKHKIGAQGVVRKGDGAVALLEQLKHILRHGSAHGA